MFSRIFGSKKAEEKKSDFVIESSDEDENDKYQPNSAFMENLKLNMSKMIAYAQSADVVLQREVAEMLANEAVSADRQAQIVEYGGLSLLVPLTKSIDMDVKRLSAHALANLSVNSKNQILMAEEGAIEMLLDLLDSTNEVIQRQAAKAIANLSVNQDNKLKVGKLGGIPCLVKLAGSTTLQVKIEAIAAIGNLAVNDFNEIEIVKQNGLEHLSSSALLAADYLKSISRNGGGHRRDRETQHWEELAAQCSRCLRNLTVNPLNRTHVIGSGVIPALKIFSQSNNDRIAQQSSKALRNLSSAGTKISSQPISDNTKPLALAPVSNEDNNKVAAAGAGNGNEEKNSYK